MARKVESDTHQLSTTKPGQTWIPQVCNSGRRFSGRTFRTGLVADGVPGVVGGLTAYPTPPTSATIKACPNTTRCWEKFLREQLWRADPKLSFSFAGLSPPVYPPKRWAWPTTSTPTLSLHAARSCCVMRPGLPSETCRLSTLVTGSTHGLVPEKKTSSAVYRS